MEVEVKERKGKERKGRSKSNKQKQIHLVVFDYSI